VVGEPPNAEERLDMLMAVAESNRPATPDPRVEAIALLIAAAPERWPCRRVAWRKTDDANLR
jgi:hypothetical protein